MSGDEATERNIATVRRFEDEFKNRRNIDIVDELMTDDFVHHLPFPGLPEGRDGMKAVGQLVFGALRDVHVTVDLVLADGDLVGDRVSGAAVRNDTGTATAWVENHIYRLRSGRIAELWPAGGPDLR